MRTLFDTFRQSLNEFFELIDLNEVQRVFDVLFSCKGTILLSGVGKSGLIAQKIAATFVSTGTRAVYLMPTSALHGDMGIVSPNDVFLALSKNGESEELVALIPYVQKKGALIISVLSDRNSRISKISDLVVYLPMQRELCPYDLAPTTSTTVQLIFGDCLAIALMQAKQFSISDFASNHPGGVLGRKSTIKVSDLMIRGDEIPLCQGKDRLIDILHELTAKRCGCILISEATTGDLQGIFTDGDLRRAIQTKGETVFQMGMDALMSSSARTVGPDAYAIEALRQMEENPNRLITVLPVVENKKIIGLLRMHDILQSGLK
jgi:arabinose-5-phosphate isomerase